MFLHLGRDVVVLLEDIVSILDISSIEKSKDTRSFLRIAEEEGFVKKIADMQPKSCIITEKVQKKSKRKQKEIKTIVYYSPISSVTLQKRVNLLESLSEK